VMSFLHESGQIDSVDVAHPRASGPAYALPRSSPLQ
jgi:hypothetical protein